MKFTKIFGKIQDNFDISAHGPQTTVMHTFFGGQNEGNVEIALNVIKFDELSIFSESVEDLESPLTSRF